MLLLARRKVCCCFSEENGVRCLCVFTLICFLAKFVRYSLKLVENIKEKVQDVEVEMCLCLVFICSMENVVCCCAASLIGEIVSKETKWRYDRVEKAVRVMGHAKDCIRCSLAKAMFAVGGNKLWSHREFCASGGFLGRGVRCFHYSGPEVKWEQGAESGNKASHRHSHFWGWHKVVSVVAYWMYLIHIQLGFLGLKVIRYKASIN